MSTLPLHQLQVVENGFSLEFVASPDDPGFAGHFPGDPVAPAALLLTWMHAALVEAGAVAAANGAVSRAKFLNPIRPGDTVLLSGQNTPKGWQVELSVRASPVANALFTPDVT